MYYVRYETFVLTLIAMSVVSIVGFAFLRCMDTTAKEYKYIQTFLLIVSCVYFCWILFAFIALKRRREQQTCTIVSGKAQSTWSQPCKVFSTNFIHNPDTFSLLVYPEKYKYRKDIQKVLGSVYDEFKTLYNSPKIVVAQRGSSSTENVKKFTTDKIQGYICDDIDMESGVLFPPGTFHVSSSSSLKDSGFILVAIVNTNVEDDNVLGINDLKPVVSPN